MCHSFSISETEAQKALPMLTERLRENRKPEKILLHFSVSFAALTPKSKNTSDFW